MANLQQYIKTTFQDYGLPSDSHTGHVYSESYAREDVQYLYNKIKNFSREVTQWDLYKITQVITDAEEFQGQINSLPPYSSAIIAARFTDGSRVYSQGDLVYKKLDGSTEHIAAERGGVFYPQTIVHTSSDNNNNNFTIGFQYATKEPAEDSIKDVIQKDNQWVVDGNLTQKQIRFNNLPWTSSTTIYGQVFIDWDQVITFPKMNVFPIIKLYDTNNEEVYIDFILEESEDNYIIQNLPEIISKVVIK